MRQRHKKAEISKQTKLLAKEVLQAVGTDPEKHCQSKEAGLTSICAGADLDSWCPFSYSARRSGLKRLVCL
eukprot:CAMPEP_0181484232 /NCGR_PEP_ID=MMETSP1110-20121109/45870_1 /TAXON_ID=174948 /ORGANISM="Symbiodinium sp., Strain CCMP421" /LENGTH=70 /DNA_ID=CAMNT_0023610047 /DNA_START=416 /DNA_END=628 /DNA_ORIENTATION=+